MGDKYAYERVRLDSPASYAAAVTPSDSTDLTNSARALYIGTTGNIQVTTVGGSQVTFNNLPVGWFPVRVKRVWAASTTATNIVAVW